MENGSYVFKSPLSENIWVPKPDIKCPWTKDLNKKITSPHTKWDWHPSKNKILPDIFAAVGNTPMVKLNTIPRNEGIECDICTDIFLDGKCEFLNPAGSIKDRMVLRALIDGEKSGRIKPGATIIEATSGNTGTAIAWACAIRGYKCILVLPDKVSLEKETIIRSLGGDVIRRSLLIPVDTPEGLFGTVHELCKKIPNSVVLDQFNNPSNPLTHYDGTAEEILYQCDGQVLGCGTGGTLTGISRKFREISPNTIIIGADPYGSTFAQPSSLNETDIKFIEIEGIGYDLQPPVCDRSNVDKWYKIYDKESLNMSRRLIKEEGLSVGTSSGVLLAVAIKAIKEFKLGKGKKVVILLPDGTRSYLTKFVRDQWMEQRGFMESVNIHNHWWWNIKVTDLNFKPFVNIKLNQTLEDVLEQMEKYSIDYLPVLDKSGFVYSITNRRDIINKLISGNSSANDPISNCMETIFSKLPSSSNLGVVSRVLEIEPYVLILDSKATTGDTALGILTCDEIFHFIRNNKNSKV